MYVEGLSMERLFSSLLLFFGFFFLFFFFFPPFFVRVSFFSVLQALVHRFQFDVRCMFDLNGINFVSF